MARNKNVGATAAGRRETVEALRRAERSKERRKNLIVIGVAAVVGLGLIAAAAVPAYLRHRDNPANQPWSALGVTAAQASCQEVEVQETTGQAQHLPTGQRIDYEDVPPTSGPHWNLPAEFPANFYTTDDRAALEELVHRLEHGYTILWYDETDVTGAALDQVRDVSQKAVEDEATRNKFIASPWDSSYGELPEDVDYVLTHWGAEQGYRQMCGQLSGEVVGDFVEAYPSSDSPEPNAI